MRATFSTATRTATGPSRSGRRRERRTSPPRVRWRKMPRPPRTRSSRFAILLRVLGHDPYDEHAHLALVACFERIGRRGEARRAYRAYVARMEELGAVPAAFPQTRAS